MNFIPRPQRHPTEQPVLTAYPPIPRRPRRRSSSGKSCSHNSIRSASITVHTSASDAKGIASDLGPHFLTSPVSTTRPPRHDVDLPASALDALPPALGRDGRKGRVVGQAEPVEGQIRAVSAVDLIAGHAKPGDPLAAQVSDGRRRSGWWAWRAVVHSIKWRGAFG